MPVVSNTEVLSTLSRLFQEKYSIKHNSALPDFKPSSLSAGTASGHSQLTGP